MKSKVVMFGVAFALAQAASAQSQAAPAAPAAEQFANDNAGIVWTWSEDQKKLVPTPLNDFVKQHGGLLTFHMSNPTDRCEGMGGK